METPKLKYRVPLELDMVPKGGGGIKIQEGLVFDTNGLYIGPKPDMTKINFASPTACDDIRRASLKLSGKMPPQEAETEDGDEPVKGIVNEPQPVFKGLSYAQVMEAKKHPGEPAFPPGTPPPLGENRPKRIYRKRGTVSAPTV